MADLGEEVGTVIFEPFPESAPLELPAPEVEEETPETVEVPEEVPA